eukprot:CAMPEP_0197022838 /NCGR_PEP_ID=MMETSP1384-20130603/3639_1 /TAXON_ID=29189 /ORGANISM="Ammonia sp." /LENGTH=278 /DNA_ID=CAMNT_0042450947 /DNA_START=87 /DNA_END=923 /DNA_ORIENTATION=+
MRKLPARCPPNSYVGWTNSLCMLHTNHDATRRLRNLYSEQKAAEKSASSTETTIRRAFNVYYDIKHLPNHFAINALLKLLLRCKAADHVTQIWSDIQNASFLRAETASMTYPLWLKCCVEANQIDIEQCIDMIEWTRSHRNDRIQVDVDSLVRLIEKCNTAKSVRYVHSLLNDAYLCLSDGADGDASMALYSSLSAAYCRSGDIRSAVNIVEKEMSAADIVMVNQVIRALTEGGDYLPAIQLYFRYYALRNSTTDKLVETVWDNLDDSRLREVELLFI